MCNGCYCRGLLSISACRENKNVSCAVCGVPIYDEIQGRGNRAIWSGFSPIFHYATAVNMFCLIPVWCSGLVVTYLACSSLLTSGSNSLFTPPTWIRLDVPVVRGLRIRADIATGSAIYRISRLGSVISLTAVHMPLWSTLTSTLACTAVSHYFSLFFCQFEQPVHWPPLPYRSVSVCFSYGVTL